MSFLNANAKHVFCKIAVIGPGAARIVDALATLPGMYAPEDPGFHVVEIVAGGFAIGPYALRLCLYAYDGDGDVDRLLLGADGVIAVGDVALPDGVPGTRATGDLDSAEHGLDLLRAIVPAIAEAARARWAK